MSFSVSPDKIIQMLLDRKRGKKEQVAAYLDSIAEDARLLADIWRDVWKQSKKKASGLELDDSDYVELRQRIDKAYGEFAPNEIQYCRLEVFYKELSNVVEGIVDSHFHNRFNYHIGALLRTRELTKENFEQVLIFINGSIFVDDENNRTKIQDVSEMIEALNREAAALEVLAKTYKASI